MAEAAMFHSSFDIRIIAGKDFCPGILPNDQEGTLVHFTPQFDQKWLDPVIEIGIGPVRHIEVQSSLAQKIPIDFSVKLAVSAATKVGFLSHAVWSEGLVWSIHKQRRLLVGCTVILATGSWLYVIGLRT